MDQLGSLVCVSREGNSACLVDHRGSLVCFFRAESSVCMTDELGSVVCFSREGDSACLVDQRGSLVCFSRQGKFCLPDGSTRISCEENYVCLMDQPGSLVCFPVREILPAQWIDDDLFPVFHAREIVLACWFVLRRLSFFFVICFLPA